VIKNLNEQAIRLTDGLSVEEKNEVMTVNQDLTRCFKEYISDKSPSDQVDAENYEELKDKVFFIS